MQNNPEIEQIVDSAIKIAREKKHAYVVTEHVLLAMLRHAPFYKLLKKYGTDTVMFDQELDAYLDSLTSIQDESPDLQPKKTNALERTFNRALTQVLFTGRRSITTLDLYFAIMAENNSHAHYFLLPSNPLCLSKLLIQHYPHRKRQR